MSSDSRGGCTSGTACEPSSVHDRHRTCCVCGVATPAGWRMVFVPGPNESVVCSHTFDAAWEGYHGFVHGGMLAAALDGAMTNWLLMHAMPAVTAELVVRYRHPVPCGREVVVRAWRIEVSGPVNEMAAEIRIAGKRMVTGKAKFICNAASARMTEIPRT